MKQEVDWKILLTRSNAEKKVCHLLSKKNIECYYPTYRTHSKWSDRVVMAVKPLFERYVFVKSSAISDLEIGQTDGILSFLYWHNEIAIISGNEVDVIKTFTKGYSNIILEKTIVRNQLSTSEQVFITTGEAVDEAGENKMYQKLSLPSLGFTLLAENTEQIVDLMVLKRPALFGQNVLNGFYR